MFWTPYMSEIEKKDAFLFVGHIVPTKIVVFGVSHTAHNFAGSTG